MIRARGSVLAAGALAAILMACAARAEVSEIRASKQNGLGYLQLTIMEDQRLIEKQAKAAGLGDVKVQWATLGGPGAMNEALISGAVDLISVGPAGHTTIWAKTRGNIDVRGLSGLNAVPLFLVTRNPRIRTITDYGPGDKIALTSVKVSMQALILQMAAAQAFGDASYAKLDPLTVSMAHPDAVIALLSGGSEIESHFSSPPYQYKELERPGIHKVLSSYDVLGERMSFNTVAATAKFVAQNPKTSAAIVAALEEATDWINHNRRAAAETYIRVTGDKTPMGEITAMMDDPEIEFTVRPKAMQKIADFMYRIGSIKVKPASWQDMYFPIAQAKGGS
jgi:NitT/TauT family transport system substrate-binding protein